MELINNSVDGGYTAVPNATVDDPRLELGALGLLLSFSRHRSGYNISLEAMGRRYGHGETALARMMGILQTAGYVAKIRCQATATGRWMTKLVVSVRPMSSEEVEGHLAALRDRRSLSDVRLVEPTTAARRLATKRMAQIASRNASDAE